MNKVKAGIIFGIIAGIIDVIPMIMQKLTWDANIAAFVMWVIVGFMVATSGLKLNGVIKGIFIGFLVLAPNAVLIGGNNPVNLIPVFVMTLILGGLLGYFISRFSKK